MANTSNTKMFCSFIFKRICRKAKIKLDLVESCHIHMCRYTAITRMIEAGIDLMVIATIKMKNALYKKQA